MNRSPFPVAMNCPGRGPRRRGRLLTGAACMLGASVVMAAIDPPRADLERRIGLSFVCLLSPGPGARPPDLTVQLTEWSEDGRYRGEVQATFRARAALDYRVYGQAARSGQVSRLESVIIETPSDQQFDKRVPARCVR